MRDALSAAGAGHIGNYRDCSFAALGTGSFMPLSGAEPFICRVGAREYVDECATRLVEIGGTAAGELCQEVGQAIGANQIAW